MNKEFRPYDNRTLVRELQTRRLFETVAEKETQTIALRQSVGQYVQSFHARNGLSRDRLGEQLSHEFNTQLTALMAPHCPDGYMTLDIYSRVIWGLPVSPAAEYNSP
jgi:hypothetical protein